MQKAVRSLNSEKGFSLIELMIVVAIIGILATIAVPNFQRMQAKAKQSEAKMQLGALHSAEKAFVAEWNVYTGDFRDIGYQPEGRLNYHVGFAGRGSVPQPPFVANATNGNGAAGAAAGSCFNSSTGGAVPANGRNSCGFTHQVQAGIPAFAATPAGGGCNAGLNPTEAAGQATFNASAIGQLNGQMDRWTMNQDKILCNNVPGV